MTENTPTPDQLEAEVIGASMQLTDEVVRAMVRTSIRDAYMETESERLGGMVTLSAEASAIWDAAADIAVDRWLAARDAEKWDAGYATGFAIGYGDDAPGSHRNPYRIEREAQR